jgi:HYR domain/Tyrosine-protein kinase ephrin type A/B receptor-like
MTFLNLIFSESAPWRPRISKRPQLRFEILKDGSAQGAVPPSDAAAVTVHRRWHHKPRVSAQYVNKRFSLLCLMTFFFLLLSSSSTTMTMSFLPAPGPGPGPSHQILIMVLADTSPVSSSISCSYLGLDADFASHRIANSYCDDDVFSSNTSVSIPCATRSTAYCNMTTEVCMYSAAEVGTPCNTVQTGVFSYLFGEANTVSTMVCDGTGHTPDSCHYCPDYEACIESGGTITFSDSSTCVCTCPSEQQALSDSGLTCADCPSGYFTINDTDTVCRECLVSDDCTGSSTWECTSSQVVCNADTGLCEYEPLPAGTRCTSSTYASDAACTGFDYGSSQCVQCYVCDECTASGGTPVLSEEGDFFYCQCPTSPSPTTCSITSADGCVLDMTVCNTADATLGCNSAVTHSVPINLYAECSGVGAEDGQSSVCVLDSSDSSTKVCAACDNTNLDSCIISTGEMDDLCVCHCSTPGRFYQQSSNSCPQCPPGTYSSADTSYTCVTCPDGQYQENVGQSSCLSNCQSPYVILYNGDDLPYSCGCPTDYPTELEDEDGNISCVSGAVSGFGSFVFGGGALNRKCYFAAGNVVSQSVKDTLNDFESFNRRYQSVQRVLYPLSNMMPTSLGLVWTGVNSILKVKPSTLDVILAIVNPDCYAYRLFAKNADLASLFTKPRQLLASSYNYVLKKASAGDAQQAHGWIAKLKKAVKRMPRIAFFKVFQKVLDLLIPSFKAAATLEAKVANLGGSKSLASTIRDNTYQWKPNNCPSGTISKGLAKLFCPKFKSIDRIKNACNNAFDGWSRDTTTVGVSFKDKLVTIIAQLSSWVTVTNTVATFVNFAIMEPWSIGLCYNNGGTRVADSDVSTLSSTPGPGDPVTRLQELYKKHPEQASAVQPQQLKRNDVFGPLKSVRLSNTLTGDYGSFEPVVRAYNTILSFHELGAQLIQRADGLRDAVSAAAEVLASISDMLENAYAFTTPFSDLADVVSPVLDFIDNILQCPGDSEVCEASAFIMAAIEVAMSPINGVVDAIMQPIIDRFTDGLLDSLGIDIDIDMSPVTDVFDRVEEFGNELVEKTTTMVSSMKASLLDIVSIDYASVIVEQHANGNTMTDYEKVAASSDAASGFRPILSCPSGKTPLVGKAVFFSPKCEAITDYAPRMRVPCVDGNGSPTTGCTVSSFVTDTCADEIVDADAAISAFANLVQPFTDVFDNFLGGVDVSNIDGLSQFDGIESWLENIVPETGLAMRAAVVAYDCVDQNTDFSFLPSEPVEELNTDAKCGGLQKVGVQSGSPDYDLCSDAVSVSTIGTVAQRCSESGYSHRYDLCTGAALLTRCSSSYCNYDTDIDTLLGSTHPIVLQEGCDFRAFIASHIKWIKRLHSSSSLPTFLGTARGVQSLAFYEGKDCKSSNRKYYWTTTKASTCYNTQPSGLQRWGYKLYCEKYQTGAKFGMNFYGQSDCSSDRQDDSFGYQTGCQNFKWDKSGASDPDWSVIANCAYGSPDGHSLNSYCSKSSWNDCFDSSGFSISDCCGRYVRLHEQTLNSAALSSETADLNEFIAALRTWQNSNAANCDTKVHGCHGAQQCTRNMWSGNSCKVTFWCGLPKYDFSTDTYEATVITHGNKEVLQCSADASGNVQKLISVIRAQVGTYGDFSPTDRTSAYQSECDNKASCYTRILSVATTDRVARVNYECVCPEGYDRYADENGNCNKCQTGYVRGADDITCQPCAAGYYNPVDSDGESSTNECVVCPAGTYSNSEGSDACTDCPRGTASAVEGATSESTCDTCPLNSYSDEVASTACTMCDVGSYTATEGSVEACDECPAGTYRSADMDYCSSPPEGYVTVDHVEEVFALPAQHYEVMLASQTSISPLDSSVRLSTSKHVRMQQHILSKLAQRKNKVRRRSRILAAAAAAATAAELSDSSSDTSFVVRRGSSAVQACAPGHEPFQGSVCTPCAVGTYQDATAGARCVLCPSGYTTADVGATSISSCSVSVVVEDRSVYEGYGCNQLIPGGLNNKKLGDGLCNGGPYNTEACEWDGGDCCPLSCETSEDFPSSCKWYTFRCYDPEYATDGQPLSLPGCDVLTTDEEDEDDTDSGTLLQSARVAARAGSYEPVFWINGARAECSCCADALSQAPGGVVALIVDGLTSAVSTCVYSSSADSFAGTTAANEFASAMANVHFYSDKIILFAAAGDTMSDDARTAAINAGASGTVIAFRRNGCPFAMIGRSGESSAGDATAWASTSTSIAAEVTLDSTPSCDDNGSGRATDSICDQEFNWDLCGYDNGACCSDTCVYDRRLGFQSCDGLDAYTCKRPDATASADVIPPSMYGLPGGGATAECDPSGDTVASAYSEADGVSATDNGCIDQAPTYTVSLIDQMSTNPSVPRIHRFEFSVADRTGNVAEETIDLFEIDTLAPVVNGAKPQSQSFQCQMQLPGGAAAHQAALQQWLNSYAGADTDSASDTCHGNDVAWSHSVQSEDTAELAATARCSNGLTVTFLVSDPASNSLATDATFTLNDTTSPTNLQVIRSPAEDEVWPADGEMKRVSFEISAEDECSSQDEIQCSISSVAVNSVAASRGSGADDDWDVPDAAGEPLTIDLRARSSSDLGNPVTYVVTLTCSDICGNEVSTDIDVFACAPDSPECSCDAGFGGSRPNCVPCEAGYFATGNHDGCTACDPGSFAANTQQSACELCSATSIAPEYASITCTPCPAGTGSQDGGLTCQGCAAGFAFNDNTNACEQCPTNSVAPPGSSSCTVCDTAGGESPNDDFSQCVDVVAPFIVSGSSCPAAVTVAVATPDELAAAGSRVPANWVEPQFDDNYAVTSVQASPAEGSSFALGTTVVQYTATDAAGNTNTDCSFNVQVVITCLTDSPVVTLVDNGSIVVELNAAGIASVSETDIVATIVDACGNTVPVDSTSVSLSASNFDCTHVGEQNINVIVTDTRGNTAAVSATVTVDDNVPPAAVATADPIQVTLDAAFGTAAVSVEDVNTGSSDACGIASMSVSPSTLDCSNVGDYPVTLTVTDVNGNSAQVSAVAQVSDNTAPTLSINNNEDIVLSLNSGGTAVFDTDALVAAGDACGISSVAVSKTNFECADISSPSSVTVTVTDVNGNTNAGTVVVEVNDSIAPEVHVSAVTVQLDDSTGFKTLGAVSADAGSTDACGIESISVSPDTFACDHIGVLQSAVLTVVDVNGNTADASFDVNVVDTSSPTVVTRPYQAALSSSGAVTVDASSVDAGSSDACTTDVNALVLNLDRDSFTCTNLGPNTVILTVTDEYGNSATESAIVTVVDVTPPLVVAKDITVALSASTGYAMISAADVDQGSTDVCTASDGLSLSIDTNSFTCANLGENTVTLTVTDASGNSASATATVTVVDESAPDSTPSNAVVELDRQGTASVSASTVSLTPSDDDVCGVASVQINPSSLTCADVGTVDVQITVTDTSGNSDVDTVSVVVHDHVAPAVFARDVSVALNPAGTATVTVEQVNWNSSDACGIDTLSLSMTTFTCADVNGKSVVLTAIDANGNSETAIAVVRTRDETAPVVQTRDVTVQLDNTGVAEITAAVVDAGSSDACGIASIDVSQTEFSCVDVGDNTAMLTVVDVNGNSDTAASIVHVEDNVTPSVRAHDNTVVELDSDGSGVLAADAVDAGSYDACGVVTRSVSPFTFDCSHVGESTNSVAFTVIDANANEASVDVMVSVRDNIAPIASAHDRVTVQLDRFGQGSVTAGQVDLDSADACGIQSTSLSTTAFTCANVGSTDVTLTVVDTNGNSATATSIVDTVDSVAPVVQTRDVTVQLDNTGVTEITAAVVDADSSDACGIASIDVSQTEFSCANVGDNTVVLTVVDVNGNSDTAASIVHVEDNVAPSVRAHDNAVVELDSDGSGVLAADAVDAGSYDACGVVTRSVSPFMFDCSHVGESTNSVAFTVIDANANEASVDVMVSVRDNIAPIASAHDRVTVQLDRFGQGSVTAGQVDLDSADACGIQSTSLSTTAFTCANVGSTDVTLTVVDTNGNSATATSIVDTVDSVAPVVQTRDVTVQLDNTGVTEITAAMVDAGSSDACGIASIDVSQTEFSCANVGDNTVVLTVTDVNGNAATGHAVVTVIDSIQPTLSISRVRLNLSSTPDAGEAVLTIDHVSSGAADSCGIQSIELSQVHFSCAHVNSNNVVDVRITDTNGNTDVVPIIVDVHDVHAPIVSCPQRNYSFLIPTRETNVEMDWQELTLDHVTDNCRSHVIISNAPVSLAPPFTNARYTPFDAFTNGGLRGDGQLVTYTATDPGANFATCDVALSVEQGCNNDADCSDESGGLPCSLQFCSYETFEAPGIRRPPRLCRAVDLHTVSGECPVCEGRRGEHKMELNKYIPRRRGDRYKTQCIALEAMYQLCREVLKVNDDTINNNANHWNKWKRKRLPVWIVPAGVDEDCDDSSNWPDDPQNGVDKCLLFGPVDGPGVQFCRTFVDQAVAGGFKQYMVAGMTVFCAVSAAAVLMIVKRRRQRSRAVVAAAATADADAAGPDIDATATDFMNVPGDSEGESEVATVTAAAPGPGIDVSENAEDLRLKQIALQYVEMARVQQSGIDSRM